MFKPEICSCACWINRTEKDAIRVINLKRNPLDWNYVICPISKTYHIFDTKRYSEKDFLADIENGNIKKLDEMAKAKREGKSLSLDLVRPNNNCHKYIYDSKQEADNTLQFVQNKNENHRQETYSYFCRTCSGWHLTSRQY